MLVRFVVHCMTDWFLKRFMRPPTEREYRSTFYILWGMHIIALRFRFPVNPLNTKNSVYRRFFRPRRSSGGYFQSTGRRVELLDRDLTFLTFLHQFINHKCDSFSGTCFYRPGNIWRTIDFCSRSKCTSYVNLMKLIFHVNISIYS